MASSVSDVRTYCFAADEELFVDANIWLFLHAPQPPNDKRVSAYSQAFKNMLAQNCRIYIDVLVLSEFINTYARLQWQIANKPHRDFKRFRKSPEFEPHAKAIADGAERVLRYCVRIENGFESLDIAALISDYAAGDSDFNDQVIASLCTERGLRLVTDDADFGGRGIPVLTANNRLLGGGHGPSS